MDPMPRPLILTLAFPAAVQHALDRLRRTHYPFEHNRVPAHLTIFRHLPGTRAADLLSALRTEAGATRVFPILLGPVAQMGEAIALPASAAPLMDLHRRLADRFEPLLVPQDRAPFRPHVTLAGKLDPAARAAALARLRASNPGFRTEAQGLFLWRYDEDRPAKPWTLLVRLGFRR